MSSSSYCQGLQSCLEPARLVEVPRVLRLKLAPSKPKNSRSPTPHKPVVLDLDCDARSNNKNVETGGWSFIRYLDNVNYGTSRSINETSESDEIYVDPRSFKSSSSALSEKSLEMCTESLGSETGSEGSETSDEMMMLSLENENYEPRERAYKFRGTTREVIKRSAASFPPPLSSLSGSTSVQMMSHREDGRLVLKAETLPSCRSNFQAERINGRLRLHLLTVYYSDSDNEEQAEAETEAESGRETPVGDEGVEEVDTEGEDGEEIDDHTWELEENRGDIDDEKGMGTLLARRRCKEGESGNKDLLNWKPFCVAA